VIERFTEIAGLSGSDGASLWPLDTRDNAECT
jgi:hypothetical protein